MKKLTRNELIKHILEDIDKDMIDEDIIHLLLERSYASSNEEKDTFPVRLSDWLAMMGGSWTFLCLFILILSLWIFYNSFSRSAFDPYPYILLNLCLSCISSLQAPIIMMSQNRQAKKEKELARNRYKITLKNEIVLQDIHCKLDKILEEINDFK